MMLPDRFSPRWNAPGRRGLARAFLKFDPPAWLPSSPAPASRRLPFIWLPRSGVGACLRAGTHRQISLDTPASPRLAAGAAKVVLPRWRDCESIAEFSEWKG